MNSRQNQQTETGADQNTERAILLKYDETEIYKYQNTYFGLQPEDIYAETQIHE